MLYLLNTLVDSFLFVYVAFLVVAFGLYFASKKHTRKLIIPPLPTPSSKNGGGGQGSSSSSTPICPFNGIWTLCGHHNMDSMLEFQGIGYIKRSIMLKVCFSLSSFSMFLSFFCFYGNHMYVSIRVHLFIH